MKKEKLINYGVTSLQVTLLVVLFVLEYLSGYKAGLAQHLYSRKIYYVAHYYQGVPLVLHGVLLFIMTVMVAKMFRRYGKKSILHFFTYLTLFTALIICFLSPFTRGLNIYAHVLMTLQFCMVVEVGVLMLIKPTT